MLIDNLRLSADDIFTVLRLILLREDCAAVVFVKVASAIGAPDVICAHVNSEDVRIAGGNSSQGLLDEPVPISRGYRREDAFECQDCNSKMLAVGLEIVVGICIANVNYFPKEVIFFLTQNPDVKEL